MRKEPVYLRDARNFGGVGDFDVDGVGGVLLQDSSEQRSGLGEKVGN
jgi:hypothetical protein